MATGISKTRWNGNGSLEKKNELKTNNNLKLTYDGKEDENVVLTIKPALLHRIWPTHQDIDGESINRLYYGDNLSILAKLLEDENILGQVKLIYIDPPFSTKSIFQSRSQQDAYTDLLSGAEYIEFIRKRLILLRELLADDGSIYVHLDSNMAFEIKIIMDEVFGRKNFKNWITRKKCSSKNYTSKTYGKVSDFILFYSKSDNYIWNRPYDKWGKEHSEKEYSYIEETTGRRYKKVPIHAPGIRKGETGKPWRNMHPPPGKHWQFIPKTLDEMDARGEIYWSSSGNPRRKLYLDESSGVAVQDIWLEFRDAHNQNIKISGYPTEKNLNLLTRIIETSSNRDDLVLDCFSGSGTTLAEATRLRRKWIGIDNSPEAISTTLRRLVIGTEKMGDFVAKKSNKKSVITTTLNGFNITEPVNGPSPISSSDFHNNISVYVSEYYQGELDASIEKWAKYL